MPIKNLSDIEKMLGLEAGTLQKGIESDEEVAVELPQLVIRTPEQEEEFKSNLEAEKKSRYDAGKEKGIKDEINSYIEKFDLDLTDKAKTFENFTEALQNKLQKDVAKPKDAEVQELSKDLETVKKSYQELQNEYNEFKTNTTQQSRNQKINQKLNEAISDENLIIPKMDAVDLFKSKYQFEWQDDDKFVIKDREGNVLKDEKTTSPLGLNDVAEQFVSRYVKKQDTGRDGKDSVTTGAQKTSYDKFVEEMKEQGYNEGSQKFLQVLNERKGEGTLEL